MASGLLLSPAYAGSSPCAIGILIAAETLLLESDVESSSCCFSWRKPRGGVLWKNSIICFRAAITGLLKKNQLHSFFIDSHWLVCFSFSPQPSSRVALLLLFFTSATVPCICMLFVICLLTQLTLCTFSFSRGWGECFPALELGTGENGATGKWGGQCTWPRGPRQRCLWGTNVRHERSWNATEPQWLWEQLRFSFCWQSDGILACLQPTLQEEDEEDVKRDSLFI